MKPFSGLRIKIWVGLSLSVITNLVTHNWEKSIGKNNIIFCVESKYLIKATISLHKLWQHCKDKALRFFYCLSLFSVIVFVIDQIKPLKKNKKAMKS